MIIEGLIGAGKSTLMTQLKAQNTDPELKYHLEPVDQYSSFMRGTKKFNPLKVMYYGGKSDKALVQSFLCEESLKYYKDCLEQLGQEGDVKVFERFVYSNINFIEAYFQQAELSEFGKDYLLSKVLKNLNLISNAPVCLVYLDISVPLALKRINERNRVGEQLITAEFLTHLKQAQLRLISVMQQALPDMLVFTIPIKEETSKEQVVELCQKYITNVKRFDDGGWFLLHEPTSLKAKRLNKAIFKYCEKSDTLDEQARYKRRFTKFTLSPVTEVPPF